ncbi:hypothetical protein ASJ81_11950 [Methanosarcina spelaei]|uniref:PEGA domain-containing protein n=1 Tax=Methanosarcina spelaei TaxID=1036679 RepID=A0A2A2HNY5_9EURY|nr:PEGA domain-containing protein [Methanosarcina spelaei]PAV10986.1 hypothetical protein ASJ81_11950 [Methanosarcina spelaei]
MDKIEQKNKKNILNTLMRYVFGVFFLLSSAVSFSSSFIAGLLFFLATLIAIPPTATQLERKFNFSMSGTIRFFVVLFLVIIAFSSVPHVDSTTVLNNSTDPIAAPLTSANGGSTIEMPTSTETSEVATISDNKGTMDIITSPTGATITVDGVAQGFSPVKGLPVDEGDHVVDLYLSGYNSKTLTVYVTNSDTKTVDWTFTPYVDSSSTEIEKSEVTDTDKSEVTDTDKSEVTDTEKSEQSKAQITTPNLKSTTSNTIETDSTLLYASSESNVYHNAGCSYVQRIKPENLITFKSVQEAKAHGYRACKKCGG